ncbi:T9SS type B sorting domain-containing protein [Sediminicola sp. 1XM1-17]|uniref:T9SS type B sorting domain-containing protein n=1 Tax=Sediminicola sp. 1XM1-17 TaxID=3127702 RepID=UPI003077DAE2
MLPRKPRHLLYAILLIALSVVCTSALANFKVHHLLTDILPVYNIDHEPSTALAENESFAKTDLTNTSTNLSTEASADYGAFASTAMFSTIITNGDETVTCSNDGSTMVRYNLCGDYDNRVVSLQAAYSSYQWERFNPGGSCVFDVNSECANTTASCWSVVSTSSNFNINASTISSSTGAGFRVRVNGSGPYYYFKVKKSTITQTYVKRNFICGAPGRIQITNLSSAYEYSINSGSGFGPYQGPIFDNLLPGTYVVKARLQNTSNTCEYPYEPIVIEQRDMDIDVTFVDAQCSGDTGSISVTANNVPGPFKYTLLDSNGVPQEFTSFIAANNYVFSAVGFGTYSVRVETQQCKGDISNGIPPPTESNDINGNPIVIGSGIVALSASTEVNNSFGCSVASVDITVRTSGGTAPYTFTVNGGATVSPAYTGSTIYTVTSPGSYDFDITDSNGCTISASATVEVLTPPDITASGVNGTCSNGGAKINFNVVDGKGYNLSFRATPADPWSTNTQLSVPAGTYNNLQVRYQQGGFDCILTLPNSVTVTTTGAINGTAVKWADRTCDGTGGTVGGSIEFQGPFSGGSGSGYVFSISGDAPANFTAQTLYNNLAPGTYIPIIKDSGGCRSQLPPITIADVAPPTGIAFAQSNVNCAAGTADVQLTVTSSFAIAKYEIIGPAPVVDNGGSNTFVALNTATAYQFRVTDINGCTYTSSYTPANISSIRARVKAGGDSRVCSGGTDGTGTFLIDGFANNYTYNINGGVESAPQIAGEVVLPPSGAGVYVINVMDVDTGCTDSTSFTITEPAAPITLGGTVTAMNCQNGNIGRVVANASGGWGNYQYTLVYPGGAPTVGPRTNRTFGNLSTPGTYNLSVRDSEGCTATFSFTLTPLSSPTISLDAATDYCYVPSTGATVVVNAAGGTPGYQYRINGGALQAGSTFSGLTPGNYTVEVIDANNCSSQLSVSINPQLRVATTIASDIPCGGADGSIRVEATNGYLVGAGPKQYEVIYDDGFVVTTSPPSPLVSNVFFYNTNASGTYVFRITDNEGCVAESNPLVLDPPLAIEATASATPASCGQANNGIATITPDATIGVPPYVISFNGSPFTSQTTYSNLTAGSTYNYIVRDSRGCETVGKTVTIPLDGTPPPNATVVPVDATCGAGVVAGSIDITGVTDGVADFTYILQDQFGAELDRIGPTASTVTSFSNVIPGNYTVITVDRYGCRDVDNVTVIQTTVDVVPEPVGPLVCNATGFSHTVNIVGGTGPFEIRLVEVPANVFVSPNLGPRRHTFNGLQYGVSYMVEVLDLGTGCTYLDIIDPIDGPTLLDVTATSTAGYCDVNRNGQISYTVTGLSGSGIRVELVNSDTGARQVIASDPGFAGAVYSNTYETLPGNYQIVATDLGDACTDGAAITINQNLPSIFILQEDPANCNAEGQFTVQGYGGAGGPYEFAYVPQGNTPDYDGTATPADPLDDFTTQTTASRPAGNYEIYIRDISGCISFGIGQIVQLDPPLPAPGITVINQCDNTATSFQIDVTMPPGVDTPRFTLGGVTQIGSPATFFVTTPGFYTIDVVDANGCTSTGIAEVFEFISASGGFTVMPTCNNADGTISVVTDGGSDDFTYQLQDGTGANIGAPIVGDRNAGVFPGVGPGNYKVLVTDNIVSDGSGNCFFLVDNIFLANPTLPVISAVLDLNVSCEGANNGGIDVILTSGSDVDTPITYNLVDFDTRALLATNNSGSFPNLPPRRYEVEVVTDRNCMVQTGMVDITEPAPFSITASAPDFSCEVGANRFSSTIITVNIIDPGTAAGGYQYSLTGFGNYQSSNQFEIIDNGAPQNFTIYAIDGNGCQTTFVLPTINPPTDVVPSLSVLRDLDCRDPEQVRIDVVGTTSFTVTTNSLVPVAPVVVVGNSFALIDLPAAGDYLFEITDNIGGCTYPLPKHTVDEPVAPTVVISEAKPIQCFGVNDGEMAITVTDYTGNYTYNVYSSDDLTATTSLATGSFHTSNNPETITGLPGGNFYVIVTSDDLPYCSGNSNVATIRTPSGPLTLSALELGNVSCDDNLGKIQASAQGGWDTSAYDYSLAIESPIGSGTFVGVVAFGPNNEFENLSSGSYRVTVRDIEGCETSTDIQLNPIPPIVAGIREPQALVCPGGNNAVLEAFDPTTGNALTALPGASGGVPGAGYKYRLLYLGSNDNTDVVSTGGLQDTPTFVGITGGYISAGWYAIEISSGFACVGVTVPYFVNPPPPIDPKLVQVQAPGCGGQGQIRLSVENPEVGYVYEYRSFSALPTDPYIDMAGTSVLITVGPGFYQYDIRKKDVTGLNVCNSVRSQGITLVNAENVDLILNLPDDISCASELDGRIESFAAGGVGNYQFQLWLGDPGDPFAPNASATLFRPTQDDGTFEGLPEGTNYYVSVISGVTCSEVEGPLVILRPDPIQFTAVPNAVSCNGLSDGSIEIDVTSGGVGLLQFAISPNFNEFFSYPTTPGQFVFDDLDAGTYEILILDEKGCSEKMTLTVLEPDVLTVSSIETPETCINAMDGSAQLTITGGTPFIDPVTLQPYYETSLNSSDPADFVRNDALFFDNLEGGETYVAFVRDARGCETNVVIPIIIGVDLTATALPEYGCEGIFPNSTVTVEMQDSSVLSRLLFSLDVDDISLATTNHTFGDLPPGDHIVYLYHENGCSTSVPFTIDAYDPLVLDAVKTGPNEITATATGGFGNYQYYFQGQNMGDNNVFTLNMDATVTIRVVDEQGCSVTITIPFKFTGMLEMPNFFTPDGNNMNDLWAPGNREMFPNMEVKIYDRYGRVVAILDDVIGWDGKYEGNEVPTGDYWYVVNANDPDKQQYVGHFTLFR